MYGDAHELAAQLGLTRYNTDNGVTIPNPYSDGFCCWYDHASPAHWLYFKFDSRAELSPRVDELDLDLCLRPRYFSAVASYNTRARGREPSPPIDESDEDDTTSDEENQDESEDEYVPPESPELPWPRAPNPHRYERRDRDDGGQTRRRLHF